jgi:hypothetical protein
MGWSRWLRLGEEVQQCLVEGTRILVPHEVRPVGCQRCICATSSLIRERYRGLCSPPTTRDLGAEVEIQVRDNGIGIPAEIKDKLFRRSLPPSRPAKGLSISWDIVTQQHGGTISVDSRIGEFTEFTVRLPRGQRATTTGEMV